MWKIVLCVFLTLGAVAQRPNDADPGNCPVVLLSGAATRNTISITFRNNNRYPLRRLEFDCRLVNDRTWTVQHVPCTQENALFLPHTEYTVSYSYMSGLHGPARVSLKRLTLSTGTTWKASPRVACRVLKIPLPRG